MCWLVRSVTDVFLCFFFSLPRKLVYRQIHFAEKAIFVQIFWKMSQWGMSASSVKWKSFWIENIVGFLREISEAPQIIKQRWSDWDVTSLSLYFRLGSKWGLIKLTPVNSTLIYSIFKNITQIIKHRWSDLKLSQNIDFVYFWTECAVYWCQLD